MPGAGSAPGIGAGGCGGCTRGKSNALPQVMGMRGCSGQGQTCASVGLAVHGQPSAQGRWAGRDDVGTSLLEAVGDGYECPRTQGWMGEVHV